MLLGFYSHLTGMWSGLRARMQKEDGVLATEYVILLVLIALVFLIRRLWIVEAISGSGERRAWHVRGWLRSRRAVHEVARELKLGVTAEPAESVGRVTGP